MKNENTVLHLSSASIRNKNVGTHLPFASMENVQE
jgi:hypothetical protein